MDEIKTYGEFRKHIMPPTERSVWHLTVYSFDYDDYESFGADPHQLLFIDSRDSSCRPMYSVYAGGIASLSSFLIIQWMPSASRAFATVQFPPPVT